MTNPFYLAYTRQTDIPIGADIWYSQNPRFVFWVYETNGVTSPYGAISDIGGLVPTWYANGAAFSQGGSTYGGMGVISPSNTLLGSTVTILRTNTGNVLYGDITAPQYYDSISNEFYALPQSFLGLPANYGYNGPIGFYSNGKNGPLDSGIIGVVSPNIILPSPVDFFFYTQPRDQSYYPDYAGGFEGLTAFQNNGGAYYVRGQSTSITQFNSLFNSNQKYFDNGAAIPPSTISGSFSTLPVPLSVTGAVYNLPIGAAIVNSSVPSGGYNQINNAYCPTAGNCELESNGLVGAFAPYLDYRGFQIPFFITSSDRLSASGSYSGGPVVWCGNMVYVLLPGPNGFYDLYTQYGFNWSNNRPLILRNYTIGVKYHHA